jgi:hypothetical protein
MRGALACLLEYFDEEPALAQLCVVETPKGGPAALELRRRVLDTLIAAVDEGRSEAKRATAPGPLTAESTVGGAVAVIHARLVEGHTRPLVELVNPLMSMIVHPYLGPAAAHKQLDRLVPVRAAISNGGTPKPERDPFKDLPIRITFRTARVLSTVAAQPGASNRDVGQAAGVADQGQMSKLLRRLEKSGLIANHGEGQAKGEPNAWELTAQGHGVLHAVGGHSGA